MGYVDAHRLSGRGLGTLLAGHLREGNLVDAVDRSGNRRAVLYVGSLAVLPEWRGKGIAGALLSSLVRGVREEGYEIAAVYATLWSERYWQKFEPDEVARDPLGHPVVRLDSIATL